MKEVREQRSRGFLQRALQGMMELSKISLVHCKICHEEGNYQSLEAPCACSGTVKFAHRDCIQRWCNEKGNTTCEICLQNFEPGYTSPPKKPDQVFTAVTIRESLEVRRREQSVQNRELRAGDELRCSYPGDRTATCFKVMALILGLCLLLRDLLNLIICGTEQYPFTILTLLILRTSGIILPVYLILRTITALKNSIKQQRQISDLESSISDIEDYEEDEEEMQSYGM